MKHLAVRSLYTVAFALALVGTPLSVAAQAAPFCDTDEPPAFLFGFSDLRTALGTTMGDPIECEHPNSANGDTLQQTTTGLAVYRQSTNTPEFTDGWNHWALTGQGVIAWAGSDQPPPTQVARSGQIQCVDVGAGLCLNAPTDMADTVSAMSKSNAAQQLLRSAAANGYSVRYANLPRDVLGLFRPSRREVILSTDLESYPPEDRGPVLAHELQHVSDWISQGSALGTPEGCLATESNAFHTESALWVELHAGRLTPPANDLEQEFNAITRAIQTNPALFASRLTLLYRDECSGQ